MTRYSYQLEVGQLMPAVIEQNNSNNDLMTNCSAFSSHIAFVRHSLNALERPVGMGRKGSMVGPHRIPMRTRTVRAVMPTTMGPATPLSTMLGKVPKMSLFDELLPELELLELLELLDDETAGMNTAGNTMAEKKKKLTHRRI